MTGHDKYNLNNKTQNYYDNLFLDFLCSTFLVHFKGMDYGMGWGVSVITGAETETEKLQ